MNKKDEKLIKAICIKYSDRATEIERGSLGNPNRARYLARCIELNNAVDGGLALCPDETVRAIVKKALLDGRYTHKSGLCPVGINQFYAIRRAVMEEIAKRLYLIV